MSWIEVAARQSGVISTGQLLDSGLSPRGIRLLTGSNHLVRMTQGVYASTLHTGPRADLWLALLACGPESFACRMAAADLWGLDGVREGQVEVAVAGGRHPRWPAAVRLRHVEPSDITEVEGVRATTVTRTLVDLGAVADLDTVERALESALRKKLVTTDALALAARSTRSLGAPRLRSVLERRPAGAPPTESEAETRFLQVCRAAGLTDPARQVRVVCRNQTYRLDFAWEPVRLAVEIDGALAHGPGQLTSDLRRQNAILLEGWLILRFTWAMIVHEPERVVADVRRAWRAQVVALSH